MAKHNCRRKGCPRFRSEFSIFLSRRRTPLFEGEPFCSESCLQSHLQNELSERWQRLQGERARAIPRPKLGTILLQQGSVTRVQLDEALILQEQTGEGRVGEWLQRLGYIDERQLTRALSKQYGIPSINLRNTAIKSDAIKMIPGQVASLFTVLPVGYDDVQDSIRIAVTPPVNFSAQLAIRRMSRKNVFAYIADEAEIRCLMETWYAPETLDLSTTPAVHTSEEIHDICRAIVKSGTDERADNLQVELGEEYLWFRLDFGGASRHQFYRQLQNPISAGTLTPEQLLLAASAR